MLQFLSVHSFSPPPLYPFFLSVFFKEISTIKKCLWDNLNTFGSICLKVRFRQALFILLLGEIGSSPDEVPCLVWDLFVIFVFAFSLFCLCYFFSCRVIYIFLFLIRFIRTVSIVTFRLVFLALHVWILFYYVSLDIYIRDNNIIWMWKSICNLHKCPRC